MFVRQIMKIKPVQLSILIMLGLLPLAVMVKAQDFSNEWTEPELLYLVTDGWRSNFLSILNDQAENLYSWWVTVNAYPRDENADQPKSITFHIQDNGGNWRSPVDVMIWPDAGRMTSVVIDASGLLHAFSATDCLNYTTAFHDQALSARGWKNVGCLDEVGLSFPSAVLTADGTLYVLYSTLDNRSYRLIHSQDAGSIWSPYLTVLEIQDNFLLDPMLAVDQKGRLHLVWSVGQAPDAYPPIGVFYSRSDDGGINWTTPIQLGGEEEGEPAIAVNNDEVHVLWNGDAAKRGRYYRYSPDGGESWSSVEVLSPPSSEGGSGGLQRPPAIVVDNMGNVHVLLHEQEALYYSTKTDLGWTVKQALYNPGEMKGVEVFGVRLAITGGDTLHALYILESFDQSKDEDRRNHIWRVFHQSIKINAIHETPVPWLSTPTEAAIPGGETQEVPGIMETSPGENPQTVYFVDDTGGAGNFNPAWPIYVGVTSVSVFILFLLIYAYLKQR
jgi:hypothetical protein